MGMQMAGTFVAATFLVALLIWTPAPVDAVHANFSDFPYIQYLTHPPEIIRKPQNQGVRVGGVASFYCAARGDPPPSIVWRKNGKKVSGTQSRYTVLEQPGGISILRIEPVRAGRDDAPYECVAENGVGDAVSADATLTIYEGDKTPAGFPVITQGPGTRVIEVGHTVQMQCKAIGNPTPTIYWIKNQTKVDMSNPRYVINNGILQINNSREEDQGKYECVAENSIGTEHSKATNLYVKVRRVPPTFSRPPETNNEVMLGSNLNLSCIAVGSPMPAVRWMKGAHDLTPENDIPIGRNVLQLTNIQESANFTCIAASSLGQIESVSVVKVQSLPTAPTDVRISEVTATSVRLEWSYKGPEDLQYYVIQYKPKNANQAFSEISGIITMFYVVRALSPYTEYEFYVIAVNNIGRGPPSTPATCTTGDFSIGGTKMESAPRNVQVRPLSSSTMIITWEPPETPNGQVTGYKVYYTTNSNQPEASWNARMIDNSELTTISELTPHAIYTVRIQAYTSMGAGPMSTPVQVKTQQGVPSQPSNFRATDIGETAVTLQWSKPTHSSENIVHYELYWNDTYANQDHHKRISNSESYTLDGLYPDTLYYIWLAARSQRGEGATTPPIPVRTKQYVPGAPPRNITAIANSSTTISLSWLPPPAERSNGRIIYYKVLFVEVGREDDEASTLTLNMTQIVLDELKRWTEYKIWVLAGTSVGDGPRSHPIIIRTQEDVPGDPQDVKATPLNSTSIHVSWKPPLEKDRNGIIRGYHIHVQEMRDEGKGFLNEPFKFDVVDMLEYSATGLQPDTKYSIQVAALTRKGDGDRSQAVIVKTPGGVPVRPTVSLKIMERDPIVSIELEWERPAQTYGELRGYRLRWGVKDQPLKEEMLSGPQMTKKRFNDLERGVEYEFRVAGSNHIGIGQETVKIFQTPEGTPAGPPSNITVRFQTPDVVCVTWDPPTRDNRNGLITRYDVQFHKKIDHGLGSERNMTLRKAVFTNLEENTEYIFRVRAYTKQGAGPFSEKIIVETERDMGRAPMSVQAVATSEQTAEIWWEPVPSRGKLLGYKIFYTMTAVEDLDDWQTKTVGLTESADLVNLEKFAQYALAIAARFKNGLGRLSEKVTVRIKPEDVPLNLRAHDVSTHSMTLSWSPPIRLNPVNYKISFDAMKVFVDSQGFSQTQTVQKREIILKHFVKTHTINELSPFTTYNVNVSAIPSDYSYRPPTKITVTTQMAAPQPMVKPDFYGVVNSEEILVILPQASEEYGPISHYYLVVVPEDKSNLHKNPDQFLTDDLLPGRNKPERPNAPYIAAKFPQRSIPFTFHLGSGDDYHNFTNRRLEREKRYRIFVRAVVDTPQKHLYTSSPFSEFLSLDMREAPPGERPHRPDPNWPSEPEVSVNRNKDEPEILWVVLPLIAAFVVSTTLIVLYVVKRRRQPCKTPDQAAVTRPLMAADLGAGPTPSDPVDMRRLNFQTPGMISHPPIPISEFANHIERLKSNDNQKFSQEYESIEPGQQFTWDNSNYEHNKSKNRYANVTAYDHSRVQLPAQENVLGSDYINANYCDGYRKHNAYVATQGPLQETFADFWRMCWELKTATIVMMTRLEERTRIKCDQYWPSRGTETYGQIFVTITETQELATYSIRTFQLCRQGFNDRREIKQLQFTAWPDHGVPDHPAPFLQFLRRCRALTPPESGPVVVHCSAGVGRTGCYIVIDSMLERMKHEKIIDIYGHVTCLRAQRNYMVQTEDQYIFIHDAILEAIICGLTEVAARNLHTHLQKLLTTEPGESISGMEVEFKKLSNVKMDSSKFVTANLACNKHKNRLVHILPYESSRVYLTPIHGIEGSDYVNASFIDGYRYRSAYIAAQGPVQDTAEDFWRMLWEHNSTIVVMLTKLKEMGREKCFQYWPHERSVRYQYYVVDPIAEYNMPQYKLREFKVTDARDGSSRTVRQFQFIDWPEQGVPKSGEGFIDFIGQVHKTKEQFGQDGPITVHCSAGVGRTGVFITLSIVLERMQYEGVLDVFQTVRILRSQRPAMVQTEDQYHFCYRAALEYLGSFDNYAN
ncbi:tyrosine-protein phosphatase Lar isoform X1 [Drosophila sulfurigaster albostrigata]|uniref:protein-tyrosine-phosphatase n=1 Tax=Drosophila albomicans TaxID=7291 RepID=A0A9C6T0A1_DROAB|nr:tyrosine-protein phosphatase Lar isoform X1 [Drosophila albomicans]XP_060644666.1 tyrosine-protein phosphatase Lar isoform X1 [Drosophila nasuta]XP_062136894.1 tyrosine-protein phosphatase Lar isoform X1 [Drosophila sulfurigaster albostrigata]XP_062136902.1 tyrosine-protein phosphatase Lar isoform X1 [Drosophila sulfurigaster albostrigata]XP_062136910.1 tyrosine-protein phosphatase Lar isoform X1 [Drosophila sulfurigaster albostrigata]XP_062136919.1 tyrosine-protein phosphatase Lar isoform 